MNKKWMVLLIILWVPFSGFAMMNHAQMSVWVNEAIVTMYTYDYKDYVMREKDMAQYFEANAWMSYLKALNNSGLIDAVKKNQYTVSAVATLPPSIKKLNARQWEATMPLLVLYQNKEQQQTQTLNAVLDFVEAPEGQGVRGLAITSIQTKKSEPPCVCSKKTSQ